MTTLPKPGDLVAAIETAVTAAIGEDVTNNTGFAKDQVLRIEKLGIRLSEMIVGGEFDGDPQGQQDFLDILADLISNFTKTLEGLGEIMVEKAWNAAVDVVWKTLDKATGLTLPRPPAP